MAAAMTLGAKVRDFLENLWKHWKTQRFLTEPLETLIKQTLLQWFNIIAKYFLEVKNFKFDKIFLFIDHSDIQDEGIFYRENSKGDIVRKWYSDTEVKNKNKKYIVKNYLKQNSFIFKFYEHFNSPKMCFTHQFSSSC